MKLMPVLKERPKGSFPRIIVVEGMVWIWIGITGPTYVLKEGEKQRFKKHGTFILKKMFSQSAYLEVKIPRKGWNLWVQYYKRVNIPAQSEVSVCRGEIHVRKIDNDEWQKMQAKLRPWWYHRKVQPTIVQSGRDVTIREAPLPVTTTKAYYVSINKHGWRAGEALEILGIVVATPQGVAPRACFHLRADDGQEDYSPVSATQNYRIISKEDVEVGNLPSVSRAIAGLSELPGWPTPSKTN